MTDAAKPPRERPTRTRTRLAPEARRDQILDAAAATLVRDGLSAVAVESLAREAGVSKALAYSYFRSRNDVLVALLQREQRDLRERGLRAALQARSFLGMLRQTTRIYLEQSRDRGALIETLLADPSIAVLMATENRAERDSTVRFLVRAARRRYDLPLETAIAAVRLLMPVTGEAGKAVSEGVLTVDESVDLCVTLITGALARLSATSRSR